MIKSPRAIPKFLRPVVSQLQGRRPLRRNHLRRNRRNPRSIYARRMRRMRFGLHVPYVPSTSAAEIAARVAIDRRPPAQKKKSAENLDVEFRQSPPELRHS